MTGAQPVVRCVLDASLLIAHLDERGHRHREATAFLYDRAGARHWMSTLTMAEVLVGYARADRLAEGQRMLTDLGIDERALPEDAAGRLAELRTRTGLKMPDCCVLLAAEDTGSAVASFDDRLRRQATRAGLTVAP